MPSSSVVLGKLWGALVGLSAPSKYLLSTKSGLTAQCGEPQNMNLGTKLVLETICLPCHVDLPTPKSWRLPPFAPKSPKKRVSARVGGGKAHAGQEGAPAPGAWPGPTSPPGGASGASKAVGPGPERQPKGMISVHSGDFFSTRALAKT